VNVRITTDIGYALVAVTALSFLGLGAQSPTPEWGLLIRDSRSYFGSAWWYLLAPGFMVMLTTVAFSLIGDAVAERTDR
jgi:peptide/nickel transport system permease protein